MQYRISPDTLQNYSTEEWQARVDLAAGRHVELDVLALFEALVARAGDLGVVDEDVVAALAGDEAEALLVVEELHGSGGH